MIDLLNNRNFDAITLGWSSGVETDIYQMFHGSQADDGGDNFVNFRNSELDRLIDEARLDITLPISQFMDEPTLTTLSQAAADLIESESTR